jgi:hypothetical protein
VAVWLELAGRETMGGVVTISPESSPSLSSPTRCVAAALAFLVVAVGGATAAPRTGRPPSLPQIGSAITIRSYDEYVRITLLSVQSPVELDNRVATTSAGNRFVAVSLRIVNLSRQRYNDSPSNGARLVTATRAAYRITLPGKEPNLDEMPAIPPGGTHTGWITFEIPARARLSTFRFVLDSGFSREHGEWRLD